MALKKTDNPESDKKPKEEGLSIEMQASLLEKMEAMTAKMDELEKKGNSGSNVNQELIDALKGMNNGSSNAGYDAMDSSGYLNPDSIDPDDVLEADDIVRFYSHKSNYVIVDDKRQGRSVQTPFKNTIMFDHMGTKTTGVGKYKETEHSCVYICKSKKEAKWLKEHSLYDSAFSSSGGTSGVMSMGSKKATKMGNLMTSLKTQDKYSIINMCRQHGIDMMEDAGEMRIALANKLADEIDVQETKADGERVKEMLLTKKEFDINN